jgi:hypothetical protein
MEREAREIEGRRGKSSGRKGGKGMVSKDKSFQHSEDGAGKGVPSITKIAYVFVLGYCLQGSKPDFF